MENKQTAVEWLKSEFDWVTNYMMDEHKEQVFNKAKAMEKEQIVKAYLEGESDGEHLDNSGENYYNETYGK